jgi:hypothetical protein
VKFTINGLAYINKINSAFEHGKRSKQRSKRGYSSAAAPEMA